MVPPTILSFDNVVEFEPFLKARVLICGGGRPVRSGEIESELYEETFLVLMKCAALVPPSRHEPCDGRDDGACSEGNALKRFQVL